MVKQKILEKFSTLDYLAYICNRNPWNGVYGDFSDSLE